MPIFHKQHYKLIADCLSDSISKEDINGTNISTKQTENIVQNISALFSNDNPQFNEKKFLQAIYKGSDIE